MRARPRPHRLARLLARLTVPKADRDYLLADLDETFRRRAASQGTVAAHRWYWWQAIRGIATLRPGGGSGALAGLRGDLRVAVRSFRRRPVYALGSAGTLLLGLASAAAVGVVAWKVWLAPLPFPDPGRLVRVFELEPDDTEGGWARLRLSPPLLEDLRSREWQALQGVAGLGEATFEWRGEEGTTQISGVRASPGFLSVLGIVPVVGRGLVETPSEPEVVLAERLWIRAFGGDPEVVDRTMTLDGTAHRIVGVAPLPAVYPGDGEVLLALEFDERQLSPEFRGARYLDAVARVHPGRSVDAARSELAAFVASLGSEFSIHQDHSAGVVPLGRDLAAPYRSVLILLLGAGGAFLLLALVNVAGMVATRRAQDRMERGVRGALGASRGRLLAGELTETVLVGAVAGLGAIPAAHLVLAPIVGLAPPETPRLDQVGVDPVVAGLLMVTGMAVGAVVGLLAHLLAPAARAVGRAPRTHAGMKGRRVLVVGQVALTTLLATGGVSVLGYVAQLRSVELGFEPEGVSTRFVGLHPTRFPDGASMIAAWDRILDGLTARGVEAVVAANPPLTGSNMRYGYRVPEDPEAYHYAQYHTVSPGYFELLGIEILEGRGVLPSDLADGEPVVVVSDRVAETHYPDGSALGRTIQLVGTDRRIVGIVNATRHFGPDRDPPNEVYIPLTQDSQPGFGLILARSPRPDLPAVLQDVLDEIDPTLAGTPTRPFTRYIREWYASLQLQMTVVLALGIVGLTLAVLGIYALVAYEVSLRRREVGIRKALGAPLAGLFRSVVRRGAALGVVGAVLGLTAWYLALPMLDGLVAGVGGAGARVPVSVALLVGLAAVAATLVPAWRSTSVDPVVSLRAE